MRVEIIQSIEHSQDWGYDSGETRDLVSIVLTAKYHYLLSKSGIRSIPKARDVPSIAAATNGQFDETFSLKILGRAKELLYDGGTLAFTG